MKHFAYSIAGCLFMCGMLTAPLHAQTVQGENLPQERRMPVPLPSAGETNESTKAHKDKIYQCEDDGTFSESSTATVATDEIFSVKDVSSHARITFKPDPMFTEEARRNETKGVVRLTLVLTASGKVADVRIIKAVADGLTATSIRASCGIHFTPALKDSRFVSQSAILEYAFNVP